MDQNRSKVRLFCWHVQCILQYFAVWYSMILWQFVPQWLKGFISARLQVEPGELLRVAVNTGFGHCSSTCHHSRTELCRVVPRSCPHLLDFGHTSLGHWDPLTQALPFFHHALPKERKNQLWKVKNATCLIEQCWQWLKWALLPKLNQLRIISIHWNLLVLGLLTHATLSFFDRLLRKHKVRLLTICSCALYRYAWSPIRIHGKNRCGLTRFDKFVTLCLWVHHLRPLRTLDLQDLSHHVSSLLLSLFQVFFSSFPPRERVACIRWLDWILSKGQNRGPNSWEKFNGVQRLCISELFSSGNGLNLSTMCSLKSCIATLQKRTSLKVAIVNCWLGISVFWQHGMGSLKPNSVQDHYPKSSWLLTAD